MRGLFHWAVDVGLAKIDPTQDVKMVKQKIEGFHVWTDDEVSAFETRWPIGTRERLAFDVLLYTGLRRGDAIRLGPEHVRGGIFRIRTEKSGVDVVAPLLPPLRHSISAGPSGDLTFIVGEKGQPFSKGGFSNWFKTACEAAGVPGSPHGLRKVGANRAAHAGATNAELKALFGWTTEAMPSLYTKGAERERLAMSGSAKMELDRVRRADKNTNDANGPNSAAPDAK